MKNVFCALLAAALMSPVAQAQTNTYQDQGSSSVAVRKNADGQTEIKTTNVTFEVARLFESEFPEHFLLKKTLIETLTDGAEGSLSQLRVEARTAGQGNFDRVAWSLNEEAHGASFDGQELYITWLGGCCGSASGFRAYNIRTGKLISTYDGNQGTAEGALTTPYVVEVPNVYPTLKRYIGVLSSDASRDFKEGARNGQTKFATITYASLNGPLQTVDVYGTLPENWGMSTSSELVDLAGNNEGAANRMMLWSSDGESNPVQAFVGFAVKLVFSAEETNEVTIPVKNDRLDVKAATVPAGFSLVVR